MLIKPSKFDLLVYRLFYWRWNKHFKANKALREFFIAYLSKYKGE